MKRFLTVALALLLTTGAFAQKTIEERNATLDAKLAKAVKDANLKNQAEVAGVIDAYNSFAKSVQAKQYYDFNYMFQAMDEVRVTFMTLQKKAPETVPSVAKIINRPVAIADGSRFITLEDYLRMETVNLPPSEQVKFDEFYGDLSDALDEAYVSRLVSKSLPKAYAETIILFRKLVRSTKMDGYYNYKIVLNMQRAMEEFNAQLKKNPKLGPAMAKEFVKPIKTLWGTVKPLEVLNEYANDGEFLDFRDDLVYYLAR